MSTKRLNIPHDLNLNMKVGDCLEIVVGETCTWCYTDFQPPPHRQCFPGGLLAPGNYAASKPPTVYGPYCAEFPGDVLIDAVTSGKCTPGGGKKIETGHSIVVS